MHRLEESMTAREFLTNITVILTVMAVGALLETVVPMLAAKPWKRDRRAANLGLKYSPSGSTIAMRIEADPVDATLSVTDEGPGIPAEHRERIFDRFYRIDEGRSRGGGGAGLGLAIAKWAVEANGGRMSLGSSGSGSVFRITLPRSGPRANPVADPEVS
jgi:light-regulated signal transduction histidine kinase (bacteriophytochrome)